VRQDRSFYLFLGFCIRFRVSDLVDDEIIVARVILFACFVQRWHAHLFLLTIFLGKHRSETSVMSMHQLFFNISWSEIFSSFYNRIFLYRFF
jgi:hypothetical protein